MVFFSYQDPLSQAGGLFNPVVLAVSLGTRAGVSRVYFNGHPTIIGQVIPYFGEQVKKIKKYSRAFKAVNFIILFTTFCLWILLSRYIQIESIEVFS